MKKTHLTCKIGVEIRWKVSLESDITEMFVGQQSQNAKMIDVHQNATLSESFEGDRSHVICNHCKFCYKL